MPKSAFPAFNQTGSLSYFSSTTIARGEPLTAMSE
jgi:hypothetical protein